MAWTIGPIALGKNPRDAKIKSPHNVKYVTVPYYSPIYWTMGVMPEVLQAKFNLSYTLAFQLRDYSRNVEVQPFRVITHREDYDGFYFFKDCKVHEKGGNVTTCPVELEFWKIGANDLIYGDRESELEEETNDWGI